MFGCIPCSPEQVADDEVNRSLVRLVGSGVGRISKVDLSPDLDTVLDQWRTSTCVANAVASGCFVGGVARGEPTDRISRKGLYATAQYTVRPGGPLRDEGSSAYAMCSGSQKHGVVSETRLPFEVDAIKAAFERGEFSLEEADRRIRAWVTEPPPFDVDVAGQDALGLEWFRAGNDPEELRLALEQKEVPCVAIPVHQNFVDWSSDEPYSEPDGAFLGFHMLCVLGFEITASGDIVFLVLNSWSRTWCRDGFIRVAGSFMRRFAFDRLAIRRCPPSR